LLRAFIVTTGKCCCGGALRLYGTRFARCSGRRAHLCGHCPAQPLP